MQAHKLDDTNEEFVADELHEEILCMLGEQPDRPLRVRQLLERSQIAQDVEEVSYALRRLKKAGDIIGHPTPDGYAGYMLAPSQPAPVAATVAGRQNPDPSPAAKQSKEKTRRPTLRERVREHVAYASGADKWLTTREIAEVLNLHIDQASKALQALHRQGHIERLYREDGRRLWRNRDGAGQPNQNETASPASVSEREHDPAKAEPAPPPATTINAATVLRDAAQAIENRAALRDCPGGERSMARAVATFNALTGAGLTETDGWQFMQCLKLARSRAGRFVPDDYTDNAAYAALAAEAAEKEVGR